MYPALLARAFLWCHARLVAHLGAQWSTALAGVSRFQNAEQIWRPCHNTARLRLDHVLCTSTSSVTGCRFCEALCSRLYFLSSFFILSFLAFFAFSPFTSSLTHIVFLGLIRARVVFHRVLLGLVLFHAIGGLHGGSERHREYHIAIGL